MSPKSGKNVTHSSSASQKDISLIANPVNSTRNGLQARLCGRVPASGSNAVPLRVDEM